MISFDPSPYRSEDLFVIATTCDSLINVESRLSTDFEKKIHPPRTFPPSTFIDFLNFFHPSLLVYCSYVLVFSKKITPSTFIDFATFAPPPRLFQPY